MPFQAPKTQFSLLLNFFKLQTITIYDLKEQRLSIKIQKSQVQIMEKLGVTTKKCKKTFSLGGRAHDRWAHPPTTITN